MVRVGLTGGLASGKSTVGRVLAGLGCLVIKADELGHAVLGRDGEAYQGVLAEFGAGVLDAGGQIDRRALAGIVFEQPERLRALTELVHPAVQLREERLLSEWASRYPDGIGIVEAAILIETGGHERFDKLIVTVCRPEQQLERAMRRDGWSREEAEARLAAQMPLKEKITYADYVVDTSGSEMRTEEQAKAIYEVLRKGTV